MKKRICILLTIVVIVIFSVCALGSGSSETTDQGGDTAQKTESSNTEIGDYTLEIQSCRLAKSWDNKDIVIVKYLFSNVSGENAESFMLAFDDEVYQNEVGLNRCYIADDSAKYSEDNQRKEIKKGGSLEVEVAYELNDTDTDIEVEVKELFSFNSKKLTKTFSIK